MRMSVDSEEAESSLAGTVTEYHLENEERQPICLSLLPLKLSEYFIPNAIKSSVYLHGRTDGGLKRIYEQVVAWKVSIQTINPKVWVLCKDQTWLRVRKPRKAYEPTIRSILVTLKCLSYLRKYPKSTETALWENVESSFRHFAIMASKTDVFKHLKLVRTMLERYEELSRSMVLCNYLGDSSRLRFNEKLQKTNFIDDDDYDEEEDDVANSSPEDSEGEEEDEDDCFDTVCAICDDGGEILCCEGKCLRSFHATKDAESSDSLCQTLGYTRAEVDEMPSFLCPNCKLKKHQCFSCGKLGTSDGLNAEVYRCISASCGHYYHPHCVASLVHPKNKDLAADLEKRIASGESFTCSAHKCIICNQVENKKEEGLQFAMCRRCPKSYHRKCLPRDISLKDLPEEGIKQRAWDGLIPNRILIYCKSHVIDESIKTPTRNHILFPHDVEERVKDFSVLNKLNRPRKRKMEDSMKEVSNYKCLTKTAKIVSFHGKAKKKKVFGKIHGSRKEATVPAFPLGTLSESPINKGFNPIKAISSKLETIPTLEKNVNLATNHPEKKDADNAPLPNAKVDHALVRAKSEAKKRIMQFVVNAPITSTMNDISMKKRMALKSAFHVDKKITLGKLEGSTEAIRAALKKVENGCSIDDAIVVCGPDVLNQVLRWESKLRVYLAPFLHGMRYTSHGRHFTKVDKLKEIVERLHWYVRDNDMIVDFSCGSNDFSLLMRDKLEERGKRCLFKNYDTFPPLNDFNYEKRDWMTVHPRELPPGNQLIMGLNPPFGVKAALANKFIDKALEFNAKLIILIVPKETKRLDKKSLAYDLIWQDETILSGKSFYLPGSVDVKDKQMEQWNNNPPSLYLWSHPDWTPIHRDIAVKRGHVIPDPGDSQPITNVHHQVTPCEEYLASSMPSSSHETDNYQNSVDSLEQNINAKEMAAYEGNEGQHSGDPVKYEVYEAGNYHHSVDRVERNICVEEMAVREEGYHHSVGPLEHARRMAAYEEDNYRRNSGRQLEQNFYGNQTAGFAEFYDENQMRSYQYQTVPLAPALPRYREHRWYGNRRHGIQRRRRRSGKHYGWP